jgi:hypothetical protein
MAGKSLVSLPIQSRALLAEVLTRQSPDLLPLLQRQGDISEDDREALTTAISNEFTTTGMDGDYEPNSRGLRLERLLDEVNRLTDQFDVEPGEAGR